MAKHKSALKHLRASKRRKTRNIRIQSEIKSFFHKAESSIGKEDRNPADIVKAISTIQRAASRGVIHKNKAARKVSRLMKKIAKSKAAA